MLGNQPLWETALRCHLALDAASIPHAIAGGVAVCLHGYPRNTVDIDLLVRGEDSQQVHDCLRRAGLAWDSAAREFRSDGGVPVQLLLSGERAGKGSEVALPDPSDVHSITSIEGLPALSLAALIQVKIACGEGNVRRTHKDFADVVELIAAHDLDGSFARHLHKSVRGTFRKLVKQAQTE
jgi:hypothetical protein